jgi:UDP-3-O-[3-hydroxymyristoyl] N-acetylglucosamine deacetylase
MSSRHTLKRTVHVEGIGLHTGRHVRLTLSPASAGTGVRFVRTDMGREVPARVECLSRLDHATRLSSGEASVETVEHLLSALYALGVDDARIELDGPEVPILDGSATPFVDLVLEAGLRALSVPRCQIEILCPIEVRRGDKWMRVSPAPELRVSYSISFEHPALRQQSASFALTPEVFASEIAPARTFGFLHEVEALRRNGLARGGTLDNALVFGEEGALSPLRFEDECVRHKILDAVGDLALLGLPLRGHVEAHRAGHALHAALAQAVIAAPHAYRVVTDAPRVRAEAASVALAAAV